MKILILTIKNNKNLETRKKLLEEAGWEVEVKILEEDYKGMEISSCFIEQCDQIPEGAMNELRK